LCGVDVQSFNLLFFYLVIKWAFTGATSLIDMPGKQIIYDHENFAKM
jgi:hypothetical protein